MQTIIVTRAFRPLLKRPLVLSFKAASRPFSASSPFLTPVLKAEESAGKGTEGPHPKGSPLFFSVQLAVTHYLCITDEQLRTVGPVHPKGATQSRSELEGKAITGDWVLFHPVYSPDETAAVKVRTV